MARGKGRLANALAKQLNHEKVTTMKRKKLENKEKFFNAKPKPKNIKPEKPFVPFEVNDRILLVGEGDFSYALSIVSENLIKPENLIATSFDSLEELQEKYLEEATSNIELLKSLGVKIFHEIDGTQLSKTLGIQGGNKRQGNGSGRTLEVLGSLELNNIIFNFPHIGQGIKNMERNIKENQKMLSGFFKSARILYDILYFQRNTTKDYKTREEQTLSSMSVEEAEWSYLNKNTLGSFARSIDREVVTVTLFDGEPYESWKIKKIARDAIGYCVQRSGKMNWETYKGYSHKRTAGLGKTNKESQQRIARIYKFEKFTKSKLDKKKKDSDDDEEE